MEKEFLPLLTSTRKIFFIKINMASILGYLAATLTTFSFLPQVIRLYRTKNTEAISAWMYSIFSAGVFLWLIYGCIIEAWPIVVANAITLLLSLCILWMKFND